ncbi:MAG: porin family protein [Alphaproteobacteria bacterium]|nr:porin family protein [Alphaproteobacteria bacterium]
MKKLLLSSLAVVGLIGTSFGAQAEDYKMGMHHGYAVMQAGFGFGHKDYKESGVFAVGGGYHMNPYLRGDITVGMRGWGKIKQDGHEADTWSIPALANVYVNIPWQKMGMYAMGGLGMSYNKTDSNSHTKGDDKMEFAWTLGAGFDYRLNDCWSLDLGYRYVDLGEGRSKLKATGEHVKDNIRSHDVLLSARYYF